MKWNTWNYFRTGLLALIQAVLITILFFPWLQLAVADNKVFLGSLWTLAAALACIFGAKQAASRGREGLPGAALGILIPVGLGFLLGLPYFLFIPLTLILFLLGMRFAYYPKRARFAFDWAIGSILLIISASLAESLAMEVTASAVLFYFALGVAAMILWNAAALEASGLQTDYRGVSRSIAVFVLFVGGISLVLGLSLSPSFFEQFVTLCRRIYFLFADLMLLLFVRPLAWLLSPLFRWADNLELQEVQLELPGGETLAEEQLQRVESTLSPEALEAAAWIGWIVLIVILGAVLGVILRRLLRRPAQEEASLIRETRESVFSGGEFLGDLKAALTGLFAPLKKFGQFRLYTGDDPVLMVRSIYARFVFKAGRRVTRTAGNTPREYARSVAEQGPDLDQAAVTILTDLYNTARYGETGDGEAVNGAKKAFEDIWK